MPQTTPIGTRSPRIPRGFTLIELLVSITIIAILAAIIFGVTGKVRASAQQTTAMSALRQVGTANLAYAGENYGGINMLRDDGEKQQEGGPNAWVSNTFWGRAQPYLFAGIEKKEQKQHQLAILAGLQSLFSSPDLKTMAGTPFSGVRSYGDLSGLPVPLAFNSRIRPAWNQPNTRLTSVERPGGTIYCTFGRYFVDESHALASEPLPSPDERRRSIYYLPNGKFIACFLDGRVETLDVPASKELFDSKI